MFTYNPHAPHPNLEPGYSPSTSGTRNSTVKECREPPMASRGMMMAVTPYNSTEENKVDVRVFNPATDHSVAVAMEEKCEVGPSAELSLFTHLLGDPLARIRRSPAYLMLVAETCGPQKEIVGLVRGCVRTVTCGTKASLGVDEPVYTKLAYILGLRVSTAHRRMGIGLKLVRKMEEWFISIGAEYAYMATDKDNAASLRLFTGRCGYSKFCTPAILVQPVFAHYLHSSRRISVIHLSSSDAELIYRSRLSTVNFFPRDIDAVLCNRLSLGTFLSIPTDYEYCSAETLLAAPPSSWALLSVWNCKEVYQLEVRGAKFLRRGLAAVSQAVDKAMPWLRLPSVPNLFQPFGFYFLYGISGEGDMAVEMVKALCRYAHNLARDGGCGVVAAEVAECEPLREGILHWRRLSCEDLWCMKRLSGNNCSDGNGSDWMTALPGISIFVDPREI